MNAESVEEIDEVAAQRSLLPAAHRISGQKARGAEAAQIGRDHSRARFRQLRRDLIIGMDVIREAMRQHDRPSRGRALLEKGDFQDLGSDGLQRRHSFTGLVVLRLDCRKERFSFSPRG